MFKKALYTTALIAALGVTPAMAEHHMGDHKDKAHKEKMAEKPNLVEIAAGDENFSTLVAALKAADLVEAIQGGEKLTIFAPTNAAFEKLPEGTVEDLLKPENKEKLQSILKYHVVGEKLKSKKIPDGTTEVATLEGTTVEVTKTDAGVTVDGATVTQADIYGSNGVIHVIDTVIMP